MHRGRDQVLHKGWWAQREAARKGEGTGVHLEGRCGNVPPLEGMKLCAEKGIAGTISIAVRDHIDGIDAENFLRGGDRELHTHETVLVANGGRGV
jgi:hypothetical protein